MDISDNNEGDELVRKGNEWEVVVLTESAYAASPGPKQDNLDISQSNLIEDDNAETAHALFMSGHFGFSPSTDENKQVEPKNKEGSFGKIHDHDVSQFMGQQGSKPDLKHEEDLHIKELIADEFLGIPQFDEKDNMPFFSSGFEDVASSNLIEKEHSIYSTGDVVSYDDKADEVTEIAETFDRSLNPGTSNVQRHIEEDKSNELPNIPCEAWWRKPAASLYGHVKNANPFWSYFIAAAVVGFVIIGRRWHRDKPQVFQLKPLLVIDDKGSGWVLGPMSRLKYATLGGQHSSYISASSTI